MLILCGYGCINTIYEIIRFYQQRFIQLYSIDLFSFTLFALCGWREGIGEFSHIEICFFDLVLRFLYVLIFLYFYFSSYEFLSLSLGVIVQIISNSLLNTFKLFSWLCYSISALLWQLFSFLRLLSCSGQLHDF